MDLCQAMPGSIQYTVCVCYANLARDLSGCA